jgi:hypothetical protein
LVFSKIKKAKQKSDLDSDSVYKNLSILTKNRMNAEKYPQINFLISKEEIKLLISQDLINSDYHFNNNFANTLTSPVEKIMYSLIWKNGDLLKIKHIVAGILDEVVQDESQSDNDDHENTPDENSPLVFNQFGKYLNNKDEPIIDQHVIRAFAVYKAKYNINPELNEVKDKRQISTLKYKIHSQLLHDYKEWLISNEISFELKKIDGYKYYIDKILFAAGKSIKLKVKK